MILFKIYPAPPAIPRGDGGGGSVGGVEGWCLSAKLLDFSRYCSVHVFLCRSIFVKRNRFISSECKKKGEFITAFCIIVEYNSIQHNYTRYQEVHKDLIVVSSGIRK